MITIKGRIVTPADVVEGMVALEGGAIVEVGPELPKGDPHHDFGSALITPGFIDVHMHGLGKFDVFEESDLVEVARMEPRFGTTGFLPGVASLSPERYLQFGRNVRAAQQTAGPDAARILGAHFEGPFINPKGKGGMEEEFLRPVDLRECRKYLDELGDCLKLMTLSPELEEADALIRLLVEHGVVVSLGHSRATPEQLHAAEEAGLSHVCHLFNTFERDNSDPKWPWKRGLLDAILDSGRLHCEVICDMIHVLPEHVVHAAGRLGPERFVAITDSLPGAGLGPGVYRMIDGRELTTQSGAARTTAEDMLVGSVLVMNRAFANLVDVCGIDLVRAARFTSTNAAGALGLSGRLGSIQLGLRGDLAVLDSDYRCIATFVDGRMVHQGMSRSIANTPI